jgi:signal transduction histidine kinase
VRHVLIHSNALVENGRFAYTRCYTRDVTDRTCLEAELRKRMDQLAELDRRKDEFLAMLGHELRNPLAPIVTAVQLIKLRGNVPAPREIDVIERQLQLMTNLVDDLLDVSRVTRGTLTLKKHVMDAREAISRAIEIASPLIACPHRGPAPVAGGRPAGNAGRWLALDARVKLMLRSSEHSVQ